MAREYDVKVHYFLDNDNGEYGGFEVLRCKSNPCSKEALYEILEKLPRCNGDNILYSHIIVSWIDAFRKMKLYSPSDIRDALQVIQKAKYRVYYIACNKGVLYERIVCRRGNSLTGILNKRVHLPGRQIMSYYVIVIDDESNVCKYIAHPHEFNQKEGG
jgi:hypothetical protein